MLKSLKRKLFWMRYRPKLTERVKIPTGLKCNSKCRFCYYFPYINAENPDTKEIKRLLKYAAERGIKDIDFSGGEPTLRPDLPDLVLYAKRLGFRKICIITNGIKMGRREYVEGLFNAGLNEVLFSVHGCDKQLHEYLTQIPGSFDNLMNGIKFSQEFGIKIRTNTTINRANFNRLDEFAELLLKINPEAVNFILFNPFYSDNEQISEMTCSFTEAEPHIKKAIDKLDKKIKKVTVRYIPFCFMQGYEKHVCNSLQTRYDPDEWLPRVQGKVEKNNPFRYYSYNLLENAVNKTFPKSKITNEILDMISVKSFILGHYTKPKKCGECKFRKICEGLKKGYASFLGIDEIRPVKGKVIRDPMHFRAGYGN